MFIELHLQEIFDKEREKSDNYNVITTSTFTDDDVEDYLFDTYNIFFMAYTMQAHETKDGSYNVGIYDFYEDGSVYRKEIIHKSLPLKKALDALESFETKCVEMSIEPNDRKDFEEETKRKHKDNPYHIRIIRPVIGSRAFYIPVNPKKGSK